MSELLFFRPTPGEAGALVATGALGTVCSLLVLFAITHSANLRQPPGRFVRSRTVFTIVQTLALVAYAIFCLVRGETRCDGTASLDAKVSDAVLIISDACETSVTLWQAAMSLDILLIVRDPFQPLRHVRKLRTLVVALTLAEPLLLSVLISPAGRAPPAAHGAPTCLSPEMFALLRVVRATLLGLDIFVIVVAAVSCAAEALPTSVRRIPAAFAAASASPREAECPPFGIAFGIGIGTVSGL